MSRNFNLRGVIHSRYVYERKLKLGKLFLCEPKDTHMFTAEIWLKEINLRGSARKGFLILPSFPLRKKLKLTEPLDWQSTSFISARTD